MERYAEALAAMTALGDERQSVSWLIALACAQAYAGDPGASETSSRMIAAAEASGERWGHAQVLMALGHDAWARGDRGRTEALARSALEHMRGFDDYAMVARMLELLAWATAVGGAHVRAAGLLGAADALWRDVGSSVAAFEPHMAAHHERCEQSVVDALGPAAYAVAFADGGRHGGPVRDVAFALADEIDASADIDVCAPVPVSLLFRREQEVAALVGKGDRRRTGGVATHGRPLCREHRCQARLQITDPDRGPVDGRPGLGVVAVGERGSHGVGPARSGPHPVTAVVLRP